MNAPARQLLFRRKPVDDERLLRLFWNRAELKREFAKLQRERQRMVDQIRQQDGTIMRMQQRLDQLEGLLADPGRAAGAAVYFQLRGVWAHGRRRLKRLAHDLSMRQQEREGQREVARFEEHRQAALAAIEQRLQPLKDQRAVIGDALVTIRAQRFERTGFWNHLRRRRLDARQADLLQAQAVLDEQIDRYEKARHDKLREKSVAPEELGVEGRRIVNLSIIALAQELVIAFAAHDISRKAREASLCQVTEARYGSLQACRAFSRQIETVLAQVEGMAELASRVRRRADYLRHTVSYEHDTDTVPGPQAVAEIPLELSPDSVPAAVGRASVAINVLADEYWEIHGALLPR